MRALFALAMLASQHEAFAMDGVPARAAIAGATRQVTLNFRGHRHVFDLYVPGPPALARAGIVLVPEYWGKDEFAAQEARKLTGEGYAVLVVDIYGEERHTKLSAVADSLQERAEAEGIEPLVDLVSESVRVIVAEAGVANERIGAIGFGYGGGLLFNLAKRGTSGLKAVVSYYGGVKKLRATSQIGALPSFLYIRPDDDVYTTDEDLKSFEHDVAKTDLRVEVARFPAAQHGFANPHAEDYGGDDGNTFMFYDAKAADSAWKTTLRFLKDNLH